MHVRQKAWSQFSRMPKRSPFLRMLSKQMPHSGSSTSKEGSNWYGLRCSSLWAPSTACERRQALPYAQRPVRKCRQIGPCGGPTGALLAGGESTARCCVGRGGAGGGGGGGIASRRAMLSSSSRMFRSHSLRFSIFFSWLTCIPSPASRRATKASISRRAFWTFRSSFNSASFFASQGGAAVDADAAVEEEPPLLASSGQG
mmetsp:Transcript_21885/g.61183  ORF Transcript_21885/g.61183 Transcript_21885/m.61183 type:complete len:201 (-) Transcript_21885:356-958(-)